MTRKADRVRSVHVVPRDDLREHEENNEGACWCQPRLEHHGRCLLVSHNSADGRELVERHGVN